MQRSTSTTASRVGIAIATAVVVLVLGAGAVFAGEITGNGTLKAVNGHSACAYSGQEDLQWFTDDSDRTRKEVATRGVPGHAQSWGQIPKAVRDELTLIGMNPGVACNPTKSTGEE